MTPEEYSVLAELTYMDFGFDGTDTSGTLQEICQRIVENAGDVTAGQNELNARLNTDYLNAAKAIANGEYPGLSNLTYAGGINHNDTTGTVAYAFNDGDTVICSFRGSEGEAKDGAIDWRDDVNAGLYGQSIQYPEALEFAREMSKGKDLLVSGHSKGANIAMYIASQLDNCKGGDVFNGQGFPEGYLTEADIQRLRNSGVTNYVVDHDLVGAIDAHYENRVFVQGKGEMQDIVDNHMISGIIFDENGHPLPSEQGILAKVIETVTIAITSGTSIATKDEIVVPQEEILSSITSFTHAQEHLQDSYKNMERAMDALNQVWMGIAHKALDYQWHTIYGNITQADEKMADAIEELRITHDLFDQNEQKLSASFFSLDQGDSPFA